MAELRVETVKCVKLQDSVGPDETTVRVDVRKLSGSHCLGEGEQVTLNAREDFTGSTRVTPIESDGGEDDEAGSVTITDTPAGVGTLTAFFNARAHADSDMTYDVHS
jgi:hypothetical protein